MKIFVNAIRIRNGGTIGVEKKEIKVYFHLTLNWVDGSSKHETYIYLYIYIYNRRILIKRHRK